MKLSNTFDKELFCKLILELLDGLDVEQCVTYWAFAGWDNIE